MAEQRHPAAVIDIESADDLRVAIHRHLKLHPMLTAFEIARALGLPHPEDGGKDRVRRRLLAMRQDGEAEGHEGSRSAGDHRKTIRWEAT